jgi:hypothetical protein
VAVLALGIARGKKRLTRPGFQDRELRFARRIKSCLMELRKDALEQLRQQSFLTREALREGWVTINGAHIFMGDPAVSGEGDQTRSLQELRSRAGELAKAFGVAPPIIEERPLNKIVIAATSGNRTFFNSGPVQGREDSKTFDTLEHEFAHYLINIGKGGGAQTDRESHGPYFMSVYEKVNAAGAKL